MPVIHQRKHGSGMYIRARHGRKMSTYQVSPNGERFLTSRGLGDGDSLDNRSLANLREHGDAFTNGSGPGTVAASTVAYAPPYPLLQNPREDEWKCAGSQRTHRAYDQNAKGSSEYLESVAAVVCALFEFLLRFILAILPCIRSLSRETVQLIDTAARTLAASEENWSIYWVVSVVLYGILAAVFAILLLSVGEAMFH